MCAHIIEVIDIFRLWAACQQPANIVLNAVCTRTYSVPCFSGMPNGTIAEWIAVTHSWIFGCVMRAQCNQAR